MADRSTSSSAACAELLSLAAHELRTPASIVSGYLRMLQQDPEVQFGERQRKMIDEAGKSCGRLIALLAELGDLAKLDADRISSNNDSFDLFGILPEVASTMHEAADRGVHLKTRGATEGAPMRGDSMRVKQAFASIFRAILREQPAACTVVAEWKRVDDAGRPQAMVVVAPDATVQSAYAASLGPFDDKRGGLGLVLPIARRVIERAGGSILAPAGSDGKPERGTAVISIPLAEQKR